MKASFTGVSPFRVLNRKDDKDMAKILIADDVALMRMSLRTILQNGGHEVVAEVDDGKAALNAFEKYKPDLVTMDISMPIMNGYEAITTILTKHPEAKIVVVSAEGNKQSVYQAIKAGAANFVVKPFEAGKVLAVIAEVLQLPSR